MTHRSEMPRESATHAGPAPGLRGGDGAPTVASAEALLHGAAFVLLCLWTRTSPDSLRDQLAGEGAACPVLEF